MTLPLSPGPHRVRLGDAEHALTVHGHGPVVIAIPGGPGFSSSYLRMPLLEERLTVVYWDPIGTGGSDVLADRTQYSRDRDVADLDLLKEHLGLERVTLFGHSAGGFVAQHYATAFPERVARLVLADTSPTNGPEFGASFQQEAQARAGRPDLQPGYAALNTFFSREVTEAEVEGWLRDIWRLYVADPEKSHAVVDFLCREAKMSLGRAKAPGSSFDFRDALSRLDVPALVIVGRHDFICAPRLSTLLHDALPGSELVVLEGCGHMAHLEEPRLFADRVAKFVTAT